MYSTCNTTVTIVYMDTLTQGIYGYEYMYGTCNTTVTILTQGYHCYYSIHGHSDTRGIYGYEYVYGTCNTTVTILTQGYS